MKHRGYSLEFILFNLGIITFIVIIGIIIFQKDPEKEEVYTYRDMELSLVTSTKEYLKQEFKDNLEDGSMRLTMNELYDKGYYTKIYDPYNKEQKCEGYVLIEIYAGVGFYEPYVRCNTNYITDGYN